MTAGPALHIAQEGAGVDIDAARQAAAEGWRPELRVAPGKDHDNDRST